MATKDQASEFDAITGANVASGDKFIVLDVSDTSSNDESGAGGTVKSITATELASVPALTSAFVNVTGETAAVDLTGASSVSVPAASAANHAARVTAIDASLGRLAIGGYEIGDTGWRDVTASLVNGWTGDLHMRRTGNTVQIYAPFWLTGTSATANVIYSIPTGFRGKSSMVWATGSGSSTVGVSSAGLSSTYRGAMNCNVTFTTTDAWPTSLPGTAA